MSDHPQPQRELPHPAMDYPPCVPLYRWQAFGFEAATRAEAVLGPVEGCCLIDAALWASGSFTQFAAVELDEATAEMLQEDGSWTPAVWFPDSRSEALERSPLPGLFRLPLDYHRY